jgi:hypothetical protein
MIRTIVDTDERLLDVATNVTEEGGVSAPEHEPIGTVRRDPVHGALAVCITGGYRVMFTDNDRVLVFSHAGDAENLDVSDWPIIWCPNASYRELDSIRRAQG